MSILDDKKIDYNKYVLLALHKEEDVHDNNDELERTQFPGLIGEVCRMLSWGQQTGTCGWGRKEEEDRSSPKLAVNSIHPQTERK